MRFFKSSASTRAIALANAASRLTNDEPDAGTEPATDPVEPAAPTEPAEPVETDPPAEPEAPAAPAESEPAADTEANERTTLAAEARGRLEMADRITAVFESDVVVGREAVAAELLAADLPTDRILATLKKLPKGQAGNDMLNRLAAEAVPALEPGRESEPAAAASADVWGGVLKGLGVKPN